MTEVVQGRCGIVGGGGGQLVNNILNDLKYKKKGLRVTELA